MREVFLYGTAPTLPTQGCVSVRHAVHRGWNITVDGDCLWNVQGGGKRRGRGIAGQIGGKANTETFAWGKDVQHMQL